MFSHFFENLDIVTLKAFHLLSLKEQKFSIKKGVFGTIDFFILNPLNEFKINQELLLKVLCTLFQWLLSDIWVLGPKLIEKCNKMDNKIDEIKAFILVLTQ